MLAEAKTRKYHLATVASVWAISFCLMSIGCADESAPNETRYSAPYFQHSDLPWISDGNGRWFLLDTGSPRTLLLPESIGEEQEYFSEDLISPEKWRDGAGFNKGNDPLVIVEFDRSLIGFATADLGGIIGADLMLSRRFTLDPRSTRIQFGDAKETLSDVIASQSTTMRMLGSGSTCFGGSARCVEYAPSRMIVQVEIEGTVANLMIDTGSRWMVLSSSFFSRLEVFPDRPTFTLFNNETSLVFARTKAVTLGDLIVSDVGVQLQDTDGRWARLQIETGVRIDGVLGFDFIKRFGTTFKAYDEKITFHGFSSMDHYVEDFEGIGFRATDDGECFRVDFLLEGGDSQRQGLVIGDCLVDVGGNHPGEKDAMAHFFAYVDTLAAGATVDVVVKRGEELISIALYTEVFLPHWVDPQVTFSN